MNGDLKTQKIMEPILFEFELAEFNLDLLPIDQEILQSDADILHSAITEYYRQIFRKLPGTAHMVTLDNRVSVQWFPNDVNDLNTIVNWVIELLQEGAYAQAEPILRSLNARYPNNSTILLNYGMMLSDLGRYEEACKLLEHLLQIEPNNPNAWNSLGVALNRQGKEAAAIEALEKSLEVDPENGYTLRNLGAFLAKTNPSAGLSYLKRAAEILPKDQAAQYGFGRCLLQIGNLDEADAVLKRAITLDEYSDISEQCRQARTEIAHRNMRSAVPGGLRMDVVMYCLAALKRFRQLTPEQTRNIASEIALLGRSGLEINNPECKYKLRTLPGEFSGLQLVSYMYVGFKQFAPELDAGIDFSKEYEAAQQMFEADEI